MDEYSRETITINAKVIQLAAIINQTALPLTDFEQETFSFLRSWLTGTKEFAIPTSGSTGTPKVISLTRHQMEQSSLATIEALSLSPGTTMLICVHTKFIAGKMQLVRAFINNMNIVAVEPSSNPLSNLDSSLQIDFAAFVPIQMHTMLEEGFEKRLNQIETIILGGAPVSEALRKQILSKLNNHVYATYGMTETISHIALQTIHEKDDIYHTLPGVKIKQDSRNCLVIEAHHLPSPVVTNDIVELLSPHSFRWSGRIDHVINSGGVKIQSEKIESIMGEIFEKLNIQQRYFIAGKADEQWGEKVLLIIEGPSLNDSLKAILQKSISKRLLKFEKPKEIISVNQFINTETGKIDRLKTLKMLEKG